MGMITERDRAELRVRFAQMDGPVRVVVVTDDDGCQFCRQTRQLAEELAALSPRIELELVDGLDDPRAATHGIDRTPAIALLRGGAEPVDTGIRFFGIPSGYEFGTLVEDILLVSRGEPDLSPETREWLDRLDEPLHLQVFVTPTCPYCPAAVLLAHRLALASPKIRADMVEAMEFPELVDRYRVMGVPRTVIDERVAVEGAVPESHLLEQMKRAAARLRVA